MFASLAEVMPTTPTLEGDDQVCCHGNVGINQIDFVDFLACRKARRAMYDPVFFF
jgi:hypothetical protein